MNADGHSSYFCLINLLDCAEMDTRAAPCLDDCIEMRCKHTGVTLSVCVQ